MCRDKRFRILLLTAAAGLGLELLGLGAQEARKDWPMLAGTPDRRGVSEMDGLPVEWDVETGKNVIWSAELGSQTYGSPVVADGKVFVGTNNESPRDPSVTGDQGVLMAFRESDGEFLWQAVSPKLETGSAQDWPLIGVCSTPLVEGKRLYFINNRNELVCLDTEGFLDGRNEGPFQEESHRNAADADIIWKLDLIQKLGVSPHNASTSSPVILDNVLYVGTSNGQSEDHSGVPSPDAPSLVAVNKDDGSVLWTDNSPGKNILNGQWTSPTLAQIDGIAQVIIGQGDGWVRGFEAVSGKQLWEFDTNPKESVYPEDRNEILSTAVVLGNYVYLANGQDPENGEGDGHLYCIDATKRGDITQSGKVWEYTGIKRSISSAVISDGLLYIPDFSGFLHCLDAGTGEVKWVHDTFAAVWASPLIAGGRLYLGDEDGDVVVLQTGPTEKVLAENYMEGAVYGPAVPAGNRLFIATRNKLFALGTRP